MLSPGWSGHGVLLGCIVLGMLANSWGLQAQKRLSDYVEYFEPIHYDPLPVHHAHLRHRRSVPSQNNPDNDEDDNPVRVDFVSHGRRFQLELRRDHSVFHNDLKIVGGDENGLHHLDTSHIYEGRVLDEPSSHCFGAIRDGVFDGQIVTRHGTYFVERVQRYSDKSQFDLKAPDNKTVHSVIYHEKHITDPFHHSRKGGLPTVPGCGVTDSVKKWMDSIQTGGENEDLPPPPPPVVSEQQKEEVQFVADEDAPPSFKYTQEANDPKRRVKRALDNPNKKKSCSLYIQTDPLFWKHIREQEVDDVKTEEEILSLIAQHVKAVNRIYSDTPFDGKYKHNGYQFEVQRIKIHNDSQCKSAGRVNADENQFCIPNIDVSNFLNLHSKSDHEEFCLAYVFTYRDFTGGTLGLAWVASASGASGGICETYKRYTENINGVHHTAKRSLNTGIITFVNYNARVPPKVSQLTLAHEIGHNFGSPHDFPPECRPGGVRGNYIMFASATSGDRDNNNKFSHCSKSNISAVLDAIVEGRKPNCFTESDGAFCGNKIVEEGEECDCGFDENECVEQCCYPRKSSALGEEENKQNRCKRKPSTECSPSEGPCCNDRCQFISRWEQISCKHEDDCTMPAVCDGQQAKCPQPDFKKDNITECNEGTQVCQEGECKSSICLKYGLESCFLTSELVQNKRELCELACRQPATAATRGGGANNRTCMSTRELVASGLIKDLGEEGLSLRPGAPCDNFQGYCDVFLKCRKVDAEGPLVRLKNLLFNQETLLTIAQWVTEFWWAVLLMGIGFVIFMAIFIRCFAIHTPSSNPNLPKNLHFTETLRRPVRSLQQKGVYVGSWILQNNVPPPQQHYRPANSGPGAPPPYPGRAPSGGNSSGGGGGGSSSGGPGHGYGEGRGHYNRSRSSYAEPALGDVRSAGGGAVSGRGGDRRSAGGHRSSRIEMQPMR